MPQQAFLGFLGFSPGVNMNDIDMADATVSSPTHESFDLDNFETLAYVALLELKSIRDKDREATSIITALRNFERETVAFDEAVERMKAYVPRVIEEIKREYEGRLDYETEMSEG